MHAGATGRGSGALRGACRHLRPLLMQWLAGALLAIGMVPACPQLAGGTAARQRQPRRPEYRLGPGDELTLTFPFNAELNHDGPIGPDGRFTVPLVGTLLIEGDTIAEASLAISTALREAGIVADAHPSLTIRRYNASVYVGGEVNKQGLLPLTVGMDAFQAVIAAGGLLDTAKAKNVAIIRRGPDGRASILHVDLRASMRGNSTARISLLEPRDVVFVPKSSIAEADKWVDLYLNKLLPFGRSFNYNLGNYPTTVTQ